MRASPSAVTHAATSMHRHSIQSAGFASNSSLCIHTLPYQLASHENINAVIQLLFVKSSTLMTVVYSRSSNVRSLVSSVCSFSPASETPIHYMCFRNYIEYSCPSLHTLINSVHPFTLCELAQHYPIPHQCAVVIDISEVSDEWCIDCWMREHDGKPKEGEDRRRVWNDRWPGGAQWSGYTGDNGRSIWRDDLPQ